MRRKRARSPPRSAALLTSALSAADPALASVVDNGLRNHCIQTTVSSYSTAARDYIRFCKARGLVPWPPDTLAYCGWLHVTAARIKVASLGVYMSGVRDACILEGYTWHLTGHEFVRRTMRFLKKKYPCKTKGSKVPITVSVIRTILPLLPGWPTLSRMSPEDRVFATATVIGVNGFLRGGEFLATKSSCRSALNRTHVRVQQVGPFSAVVIQVLQPKTRWWLASVAVPCFAHPTDDEYCPVRLWEEYMGSRRDTLAPAFLLDGKPLTRNYMVARTTALMQSANMSFVDLAGIPMAVKAASWRSGAVCSAIKANVSVPHIMALGRWTSDAWMNYLLQAPPDLQGSASSMWTAPSLQLSQPASGSLGVVEFDVGGFFAPFTSRTINSQLENLRIDVNTL
jgi:hypothetical protein